MTQSHPIKIQVEQTASRLDQYLAHQLPQLSRSQIQKLIRQGNVTRTKAHYGPPEQPVRASDDLQPGDVITLHLPETPSSDLVAEEIPLDILFEDEALLVINKPAGLVVHPAQGHPGGTLVNALMARYPDLAAMQTVEANAQSRPGIVHRLDRDTSGVIVVARTAEALHSLQRQFKAHTVEKTYLALVFGQPDMPAGIIDVPLGRDPRHRQKFAARADGKAARTHYQVRETFNYYSLLEIGLETGRTHQIRVHLAWLGCPVVGDTVYGRRKNSLGLTRQFLHAWRLRFDHPVTGEILEVEAPLAEDLEVILERLRR